MQGPYQNKGDDAEQKQKTGTALEEVVDGGVENNNCRDEGGEKDLGGEDAVDLADEAPSKEILSMAEPWIEGITTSDL